MLSLIVRSVNELAERTVRDVVSELKDEKKRGGYFCLSETDGRILAVTCVGVVDDLQKADSYLKFCVEKAKRLGSNPDHVSGWQSRNEANYCFGGAIRLNSGIILSFSGFPEHWDEYAMFRLGIELSGHYLKLFRLTRKRICEIRDISKNPLIVAV